MPRYRITTLETHTILCVYDIDCDAWENPESRLQQIREGQLEYVHHEHPHDRHVECILKIGGRR